MVIIRNIKWNKNNRNLPNIMTVPVAEIVNHGEITGVEVAWYLADKAGFVNFPESFTFEVW